MTLGSKIENLKTMKKAGLPVPEFETFSFDELVPSKAIIESALREAQGKSVAEKSRILKEAARLSVITSGKNQYERGVVFGTLILVC